ncbi:MULTISPECIES: DUF1116 domain-containing protein [unclassified Acinetobacter]|uniref:oxamate carbamoyltransferase subunit AllG family protein n=1 Tax=unclassified Acinetobacter TaxID=196816 RepID=UPI002934163C|nr:MULTISPECIES: DUF1116 domain-containing protein [unclassified Acinetobacter]WOE32205.1 DUF1116 domain-containing protein [Acinetobacter sp. SAAs470]WOE37675.1 DUF1116 domain-containing protein [Acinetobacter sp. SAAs474]
MTGLLAGIILSSIYLIEIKNAKSLNEMTYAALNEGMTWYTRSGILGEKIITHLYRLHSVFAH